MAEKELNVRVKNRVATESQWNSSTDIPKEGELLIYEPSSSTSASNQYRIKIGNGTSRPSQLSFAIDPTDFSDPTVTQTYSSAGTRYPVLASALSASTSSRTTTALFNDDISITPSIGSMSANYFSGNGSLLDGLNASNISTGTLPLAGGTGATSALSARMNLQVPMARMGGGFTSAAFTTTIGLGDTHLGIVNIDVQGIYLINYVFSCFNSKWCNARLSIIDNGTERKDMWHTCCGEYHANYIYHNLTEIVPLNSGSQVYLNIYKEGSESREAYYRYYIMRLTTYMS